MKSYQEFFNLTEENNQITKDFLKHVVSSSGGRFSDASNSNKSIIRIPSGMKNAEIISVFKTALSKIKNEYDDIKNFSSIVFKEKGRKSSGSDGYPAIIGGDAPNKGFSAYGDGFRIFITDKDDGGDSDAGGGGGKPKAADYEASICVEYNVKQLMAKNKKRSEVVNEAMDITFGSDNKKIQSYVKKANPLGSETPLTKTGKAVSQALSGPQYFVHAGTGLPNAKNNYQGGSDNTPKSDIVGWNGGNDYPQQYRYSLKKVGDGAGAQLMSGKKAESKGIFKASWDSWKIGASSKKGIVSLLENMEKKLTDNIEISQGAAAIKAKLKKWLLEGIYAKQIINQTRQKLVSNYRKVWILNNKKQFEIVDAGSLSDVQVQNYVKAIFSLSGLLEERGNPNNYLFYEVVRGQDERGSMIDVVIGGIYTINIRNKGAQRGKLYELYKKTLAVDEKEEISAILNASLKGKELREDISEFISNNENIKKHIVFEAGSGWFKFTGSTHPTSKDGDIMNSDSGSPAVADSILEFNDGGLGYIVRMNDYANKKADLVGRIYVAFKGSGDVRYTSVRMPTESLESGNELNSLIENSVSKHFDFLYEDLLMENLFGKLKDYASGAWQKTKQVAASVAQYGKAILNDVLDFSKRLYEAALGTIKKIFSELHTILSQGVSTFLDFVGLGEPEGNFTISG